MSYRIDRVMINCSEPGNSFGERMILVDDSIHLKLDNDVRPRKVHCLDVHQVRQCINDISLLV
jgi:hypothetical protein